jgi:hypothetical protein
MTGPTTNSDGVFPENALRPKRPAEAHRAQPAPAGLTGDSATQPNRGRTGPQVTTQVVTVSCPFRTAQRPAERR